jgi:hypothetical protein
MVIDHEIHIAAAPDAVWSITTDVERWPSWTPTVTSVARIDRGPFGLGSVARIKQPAQPTGYWTVTEFAEGRRFVWETRQPGLRLKGAHELTPEGTGTKNRLRVEAKGTLAFFLRPLLRLAMRRALAAENHGLKARCELSLANPPLAVAA